MAEKFAMENLSGKITPAEIYNELKSQNFIDKMCKDALVRLKQTVSYRRMTELATQLISDVVVDNSTNMPGKEDRTEKKIKISEIGLLALQVDSEMSNIVSEKVAKEGPSLVDETIRKLASRYLENAVGEESLSETEGRRNLCSSSSAGKSFEKNVMFKEYRNPNVANLDHDSDASMGDIIGSVSSVHTSDLSSFDDRISSSDHENESKQEKKSPQTANPHLKGKARGRKNKKAKKAATLKQPESAVNSSVSSDVTRKVLPKRTRKPNSKYEDMLMLPEHGAIPRMLFDHTYHIGLQQDKQAKNEGASTLSPRKNKKKST